MGTILHNYGTSSLDIGPDDQPKKNQKKNQNRITFIYAPYYTIMELLHWTLDLTINPKKSKKKSKKNQNKITFIYAPYYTIMELFHWTLDLTINPKKIKKKSPLSMHHTTQLWNFFIGHWT